MSINRVTISGNLTRDSELRTTRTGTDVLNLSVAVNDRRKNTATGQWEDCPNFVDCVMFGAHARSVSNYLLKGAKVAIEGKLRWEQWEHNGQKRSRLKVIVDKIEFMSGRRSDGEQSYGDSYSNNEQPPDTDDDMASSGYADGSFYDEDIPF